MNRRSSSSLEERGLRMNRKKLVLGVAAVAMAACATGAFGCTVCFGESDHPIVKGAEASVLFMVAVTYLLLASGVVSFFLLRRRARRMAEQNAGVTDARHPSGARLSPDQGACRQ